jgi:hypothetical protein
MRGIASSKPALLSKKWSTRISRRLTRAEPTMRVRIARDELRRPRELTQAISWLEREITELVQQIAPQLLRRRDRRRPALCHTGQARPRSRRRTDPRQLGQHPAPPTRPGRQPPDQRRAAPPALSRRRSLASIATALRRRSEQRPAVLGVEPAHLDIGGLDTGVRWIRLFAPSVECLGGIPDLEGVHASRIDAIGGDRQVDAAIGRALA